MTPVTCPPTRDERPRDHVFQGKLLTKRRSIDFGRVATCLCRPA